MQLYLRNHYILAAVFFVCTCVICGCGKEDTDEAESAPVAVKAMRITAQETPPLSIEFPGHLSSVAEVKVQAKVSGRVIEKYVSGGDWVHQGQPLYRLESAQYEAEAESRQANLVQVEAKLQNARIDLARNQELLKAKAIAEQQVTTQASNVRSLEEQAAAQGALLKYALENLDDTVVYAPMDGKLAVDDVAVGTYATAGVTTLVSVSAPNPIYMQFNVPEKGYLKIISYLSSTNGEANPYVTITLNNGKEYPLRGEIVEADRSLAEETGTLAIKAIFPNPNAVLLPGMFARVKITGGSMKDAVLVPQNAIQELLGKKFVLVIDENNKSVSRVVETTLKIGDYYLVESGLSDGDVVIVEGLTNLQGGQMVEPSIVTAEDLGLSTTSKQTAERK